MLKFYYSFHLNALEYGFRKEHLNLILKMELFPNHLAVVGASADDVVLAALGLAGRGLPAITEPLHGGLCSLFTSKRDSTVMCLLLSSC